MRTSDPADLIRLGGAKADPGVEIGGHIARGLGAPSGVQGQKPGQESGG